MLLPSKSSTPRLYASGPKPAAAVFPVMRLESLIVRTLCQFQMPPPWAGPATPVQAIVLWPPST